MKIALVGPVHPYRGGIAHYTALLAAHLTLTMSHSLYVGLLRLVTAIYGVLLAWLHLGAVGLISNKKPVYASQDRLGTWNRCLM